MYDFNKKRNHVNNLLFTAHLLKLHTKYLFTYNIPIKQPILPAFGDSKRRDNLSFTRDFHHCAHDLDAPKKISRQTAGRKGERHGLRTPVSGEKNGEVLIGVKIRRCGRCATRAAAGR